MNRPFFPKPIPLRTSRSQTQAALHSRDSCPEYHSWPGPDSAGKPLEQAVVSVDIVQQGNTGHGTPPPGTDPLAITDDQGNFALYSKQPFDSMELKVEARAMAPKRFSGVRGGGPPTTFVITEGASLKGRVLLDGKPLKDASIGAVSVDRSMENFSGDLESRPPKMALLLFQISLPTGIISSMAC